MLLLINIKSNYYRLLKSAIITLTLIFFSGKYCYAQQYNLVPNYSFEDSVQCPKYLNNPLPRPWYTPSNYSKNTFFVHACSLDTITGVPYNRYCVKNYQFPRTGNGYAGIQVYFYGSNYRAYIQVKLKDSLRAGHCYQCSFYTNLPNPALNASNNVTMLLTNAAIYSDTIANPTGIKMITANPQVFNYGNPIITDTMNWVKVSSIYTATGGENYITLGNFKTDAQTNIAIVNPNGCSTLAYFIDDVSITPLDSVPLQADAGIDQTMSPGDSVYIGSYTNGLTNVVWYNSTGGILTTGMPGMYVKPTASTFYVLEQTVCGQYSRDTVYVNVGVVPLSFLSYALGVKSGGVVNKWVTANEINVSHFNIQRSTDGVEFNTIQQTTARNKDYNEYSVLIIPPSGDRGGTSYYRIEAVDKDGKRTYSSIQSIKLTTHDSQFTIYPNPTSNFINITGKDIKKVELLDVYGKALDTKITDFNTTTIPLARFSNGIYFIRITKADKSIVVKRIVKY